MSQALDKEGGNFLDVKGTLLSNAKVNRDRSEVITFEDSLSGLREVILGPLGKRCGNIGNHFISAAGVPLCFAERARGATGVSHDEEVS